MKDTALLKMLYRIRIAIWPSIRPKRCPHATAPMHRSDDRKPIGILPSLGRRSSCYSDPRVGCECHCKAEIDSTGQLTRLKLCCETRLGWIVVSMFQADSCGDWTELQSPAHGLLTCQQQFGRMLCVPQMYVAQVADAQLDFSDFAHPWMTPIRFSTWALLPACVHSAEFS